MTFDSIFYSGAITCFVYPSANRTLLLQERTGHLRAQPVETHVYPNCFSSSLFFCFDRHFEFSSRLFLYTSSQTPVPGSPFPVFVTSHFYSRLYHTDIPTSIQFQAGWKDLWKSTTTGKIQIFSTLFHDFRCFFGIIGGIIETPA